MRLLAATDPLDEPRPVMDAPPARSERFVTVAYGPSDDDLSVIVLAAELAAARGARIVAVRIGGDVPQGRFAAELHAQEVDRLRRAARGVPLTAVVWPAARQLRDLADLARRSGTGVLVHGARLEGGHAHRGAVCPVVRAYPASPAPSPPHVGGVAEHRCGALPSVARYQPHPLPIGTAVRGTSASSTGC
jgi:hypothetical protein